MSKSKTLFSVYFIPLITLTFLLSTSSLAAAKQRYYRSISPKTLGLHEEKLTHLRFFFHDVVTGPNTTTVEVVKPIDISTFFGGVTVIDDPLTVGPERGSKLVGRAQGIYAGASQEEVGLLLAMNFAFTEGKFNGSTLAVLGRNRIFTAVREMPIVGGSGAFRFARGYVQARTHTINVTSMNAVVEYNVYAFHY